MKRIIIGSYHWSRRMVLLGGALFIAMLLLLAAVMPLANDTRQFVAERLSQVIDRPVQIGAIHASWMGIKPLIKLNDVHILDPSSKSSAIHFDSIRIKINPIWSFIHLRPYVETLGISGTRLTLIRDTQGDFRLQGFKRVRNNAAALSIRDVLERLRGVKVHFKNLLLLWLDDQQDKEFEFFAKRVDLYAGSAEVGAEGEVLLPQNIGDAVGFKAVAKGPFDRPSDWDISFYLRGESIDLGGLPIKRPGALAQVESGVLDLEFWGDWRRATGLDLEGHVGLYDLRINEPDVGKATSRFTFLDEFETNLRLTGYQEAWRMDLDGLKVIMPEKHWLQGGLSIAYDAAKARYTGAVDYADLGSLAALATVMPGLDVRMRELLQRLSLSGEIYNLRFTLPRKIAGSTWLDGASSPNAAPLHLSGEVANAGWAPGPTWPGLSGVTAQFDFNDLDGSLYVKSQQLGVYFPRLFQNPLLFDRVSANVALRRAGEELEIATDHLALENPEVGITGTAVLRLGQAEGLPHLDAELISPGISLGAVKHYLPVNIMPKNAAKWLQQAFDRGRASDAKFSYHGPLQQAAFKQGEAKMLAEFGVSEADLSYRPDWPRLQALKGTVRFENAHLSVQGGHGHLFATPLRSIDVDIPNLYRGELRIKGQADGPLQDGVRYLRESPLGKDMQAFLALVQTQGRSHLDLDLYIPLSRKLHKQMTLDGAVRLQRCSAALKGQNLRFSNLQGTLRFTRDRFTANDLTGEFRGEPVTAKVATRETGITEVELAGRFYADQLLPEQARVLQAIAKGRADWTAVVQIPGHAKSAKRSRHPPVVLQVVSQLEGITLKLPKPLYKPAAEPRRLEVEYQFLPSNPPLTVRLGKQFEFKARMHLKPVFGVQRAGLGLGGSAAELPASDTIEVTGHWPVADVAQWATSLAQWPRDNSPRPSLLDQVTQVDVTLGTVTVGAQHFTDVGVSAARQANQWRLSVVSDDLSGQAVIPASWPASQPWRLQLQQLRLRDRPASEPTATQTGGVRPSVLPPLELNIDQFEWGARRVEQIHIVTRPQRKGLVIQDLTLDSDVLQVMATGDWTETGGSQRTTIDLVVKGQNVGQVLADLGFGTTLGSGVGTLKGQLAWQSAAYDFDVASLDGELEVDVTDGNLSDVDPGLGRIIGLLSLDQLPRRLNLDFKDVAEAGFHYDHLVGSATIKHGDLEVDTLQIDGPLASLSLQGHTNLVAKNQDLKLELIPKFKSTVPLAAGILAGPQAGVLAFVFDKLAESMGVDINKTAMLNFDITGTWDKPVIEGVNAQDEAGSIIDIPLE